VYLPSPDVIDSFQSKFIGCDAVAALEIHFNQCVVSLNTEMFVPYISVVQSSGTGKTRLFFQYAEQNKVLLFYACLRDSDVSGYPYPSTFKSHIMDALKCGSSAERFVDSLIDQISAVSQSDNRQSFYQSNIKIPGNVSSTQNDDSLFQQFWGQVLDNFSHRIARTDDELRRVHAIRSVQHLVVFDEARALLAIPPQTVALNQQANKNSPSPPNEPYFIYLRRAISSRRELLKKLGIMFVFIDTTSKVANFSPPISKSSGSGRLQKNQLLPPFHNVANCANLYWLKFSTAEMPPMDDFNVFLFGRPLWWTTCSGKYGLAVLLKFAQQKLMCAAETEAFSAIGRERQQATSAAIVCCLLDLSLTPGSQLSVSLISSHMV
jgi:hypothetical protein